MQRCGDATTTCAPAASLKLACLGSLPGPQSANSTQTPYNAHNLCTLPSTNAHGVEDVQALRRSGAVPMTSSWLPAQARTPPNSCGASPGWVSRRASPHQTRHQPLQAQSDT
ncbi:hypothetical protein PMIN06_005327 [Paraphaeosphaeria minitans]